MARWATKLLSALVLSTLCLAIFVPAASTVWAQTQSRADAATAARGGASGNQAAPAPGAGGTGETAEKSGSIFSALIDLPMRVVEIPLSNVVRPIAAQLVWIAGVVFDKAVEYSLTSTNFITGTSGEIINFGWTLVRDICNITFIFALIFASMQVILGQGDAKKSITDIIIAALLVNFSLFFTKVMIDISNLFALSFKTAIDVLVTNTGNGVTSMSYFITNKLGLVELGKTAGSLLGSSERVLGLFLRIGLMLVLAYSLLQAAIIFLSRIVTIIFLMIFSPLGFIGLFIPKLKGFADDWWKNLNDVAMVSPVFLFTLYIILRLLGSDAFVKSLTITPGQSVSAEQYLSFFIIIFLLNKAVKTAKSMAGEFGAMALKAGNFAAGLTLGAVTGGTALAGRAVVGRGAAALAGKYGDSLKNVASKGGLVGALAQGTRSTLKGASTSSFDIRATKTAGKLGSALGGLGVSDISIGSAGGKGGYKKYVEEREKKEKEYAADLGAPKAVEDMAKLEKTRKEYEKKVKDTQDGLEGEKKKAEKDKTELATKKTEHEVELARATEARDRAYTPEERTRAESQMNEAQNKIAANVSQSAALDTKIANIVEKIGQVEGNVTKEMGISLEELMQDIEKTQGKIDQGIARQQNYAQSIENSVLGTVQRAAESNVATKGLVGILTTVTGTMGLDERKSLAKEIRRMRKVKKDDAKKKMKDLLEEVGGDEDDKEKK